MNLDLSHLDMGGVALLQTKLHRPRVMQQFVPRPHLWKRLDQGLDGALILVCAGAGCGKTTLISSWLEDMVARPGEHRALFPATWLSLDEYDSDISVFLRYWAAALRKIFPEACSETLDLVQSPQPAPLATLVATLSNELAMLRDDFILVLDDYHAIKGEAVPDLLAALAQHWPNSLHLVLITRHNPPLPITSLRARGQLTELRTRDLRFSGNEVRQYVNRMVEVPPDEAVLDQLERQTEGWIAGLYLATLALREGGAAAALAALAEAGGDIGDYFINDVLAQQSPDVWQFLLKTSILDRWCLPLCQHIIEADPADRSVHRYLEWLERMNFFIIPLDDRREWHRYHHLLQEVLRRRAQTTFGPDQIIELHLRAAAWFEQQGLFEEALQHALQGGDFNQSEQLMQRRFCEVLNREDRATLDRWLGMLPHDFVQQSPWLLMIQCLALQFAWRLEAIPPILERIETLLQNSASKSFVTDLPILRGIMLALQGELAFFRNQADTSVASVQQSLPLVPEAWTHVRGSCLLFLGISMQALGQSDVAAELLWAQYTAWHDKTDAGATRILFALCLNDIQAGQLERARQVGALMLEQARRGGLRVLQGWANYWLGLIAYAWNDLETAAQHFQAVVDLRFAIHARTARNGLMALSLTELARGDSVQAWDMLRLLSEYEIVLLGMESDETRSLRAQLQMLHGQTRSALAWADAFTAPLPDQPLLWLQDAHITKARLLLARGTPKDLQAAISIVDALHQVAVRTHNIRFTIVSVILHAVALDAQDRHGAAREALQNAIEMARAGGFIRVFVDQGPSVQALLSRLVQQCPRDDFMNRVLAAFPESGAQPALPVSASAPLIEALTPREQDVLLLMRKRLSDKEIARELNLSLGTVKRHAANVYQKLGVNKRWDAVAQAEALHLLTPR